MRRPDESKMAFLRLRSPKEKGMDDVRLKSPVGVYTGEPVPLTASSGYPVRTVALLLTYVCLVCLFISGFLNGITPAVFPAARSVWLYNMLLRNGGNGVVPEYPRIKTMFKNEWTYQDSGVKGDAAWRDMLPKGHGVVELRWPEHLKLPKDSHYTTEQEQGGIELAEVSVVKELDCLIKIRSVLIGYEYNMKLNQNMKIEVHTCLEYVRQAIVCSSDTTMEKAWNATALGTQNVGEEVFEGERAAHTCKDWSKIRTWLEENKKGRSG